MIHGSFMVLNFHRLSFLLQQTYLKDLCLTNNSNVKYIKNEYIKEIETISHHAIKSGCFIKFWLLHHVMLCTKSTLFDYLLARKRPHRSWLPSGTY